MEMTSQFMLLIIAILGLAGGCFAAFNNIGQRVTRIETHLEHIMHKLGVKERRDYEDD